MPSEDTPFFRKVREGSVKRKKKGGLLKSETTMFSKDSRGSVWEDRLLKVSAAVLAAEVS